MKLVQKFQRVIAAFLLTLLLFSASVQNTVALGLYEQTTASYTPDAVLEQAAVPAVAAAAFGVVLVGAFAYGVYTGYREASKGGAQAHHYPDLEMYQSDDFSQFDLQAAAS